MHAGSTEQKILENRGPGKKKAAQTPGDAEKGKWRLQRSGRKEGVRCKPEGGVFGGVGVKKGTHQKRLRPCQGGGPSLMARLSQGTGVAVRRRTQTERMIQINGGGKRSLGRV